MAARLAGVAERPRAGYDRGEGRCAACFSLPGEVSVRWTSIPQLARNANRLREVVGILSKYGLADWIWQTDLEIAKGLLTGPEGTQLASLNREQRIKLAITELGPTFIKFGQMLSTRADLIGPALADELTGLQAGTPADPPDVVRATIERELKRPLPEMFVSFEDEPLASASIGQVHRARLPDGRQVAVKVQHADIETKIQNDLEILAGLADLAEAHLPELRNYRPRATAAEFQRVLRRELDFDRERRNLIEFASRFRGQLGVRFPKPVDELSTSRVLTMDYFDGLRLKDTEQLRAAGRDLPALARAGAEIFLRMIFEHGFYHADPHPGNFIVLDEGVIGLVDCGMVGRLDERTREQVEEMLCALAARDSGQLSAVILRVGSAPAALDQSGLEYDVHEFLAHYADQPLDRFDLSGALTEVIELIRRYQIVLPPGVALLIKVLVMLEGTARLLAPDFNLTELIQPYQRQLLLRRMSPLRQFKRVRRVVREWEHLGEVLPRSVSDLLGQFQTGRFEAHLQHRGLEPSVNRLVLGMLASALFLGSSWLWSNHVPPTLGGVSIFGVLGCGTAVVLGLRLMRAIAKSGRLDQRE